MKAFWNRPYAAHLVVLSLFSLLTILMTYPLALHASNRLLGTDSNALNDSYFSVWIFGWQAHQLIANPLALFQANIFYPFANTLAFSEIILPGALLYLPLAYASNNPILAYNLVVLASFPLNAFAMYLLALEWLKTTNQSQAVTAPGAPTALVTPRARFITLSAAFLAGLIFAFCTYKLGELRHVQLLLALFMPLTFLYLMRFLRLPNFHNAFFVALFFALNALSSLYYAVFLAFGILVYLLIDLVLRRGRYMRAHIVYGVSAAVIAVILVAPFLIPFLQLESATNFSEGRDPRLFSARPYSYIAAPATQWLYGNLTRNFYTASKGQPLLPGIVVLLLALAGALVLIRHRNRAWIFPVLLGLVGFVLSFGPVLVLGRTSDSPIPYHLPYYWLSFIVTPLKSLNAPSRFVVISMVGLALLVAYGAVALFTRFPRYAPALAVLCAALILLEYIAVPLRLTHVDTAADVSPVYTFLKSQDPGEPVVEMPMGRPIFSEQDKYVSYTYNSLYHLQPLINGYSTFIPPDYYALVKGEQNFPAAGAVKRLKAYGAQWVIVHSDRYPDATALRTRLGKLKGLEHVQDFGVVWLYRLSPNP